MWNDRREAGVALAQRLSSYRDMQGCVVVGLARGGVLVASVVAGVLHLPLAPLVVKKLPSPGNSELALGAVAPVGIIVVDRNRAAALGVDEAYIRDTGRNLSAIVKEKMAAYEKSKPMPSVQSKHILLVDDGVATGATMEAAIAWCRKMGTGEIVVAVPVIAEDTAPRIKKQVRDLVALITARDMGAVGEYYRSFEQVEDRDVIQLVKEHL